MYESHPNLVGFPMQALGAEIFGWCKEPLTTLEEFKTRTFRTPGGIAMQAYQRVGVAAQSDSSNYSVDCYEWNGPAGDISRGMVGYGFKHLYVTPLHQPIGMIELVFNREKFNTLPEHHRRLIQELAMAQQVEFYIKRIDLNADAMHVLRKEHGVTFHTTLPEGLAEAYKTAVAEVIQEKIAAGDTYLGEVYNAHKEFHERHSEWRIMSMKGDIGLYAQSGDAGEKHCSALKSEFRSKECCQYSD